MRIGTLERVIAYIDGFNLYFGLKSKGWRRYYWLDPRALVLNLLKPTQQLVFTKYFTARITSPTVNIAVEMVKDAYDEAFDTALVISADSDLTAPVEALRARFQKKRVVVACPPDRQSKRLKSAASAYFRIGRKRIQDSQFPDEVVKPGGFVLKRPSSWR
jgi:hypothetical protein